MTITQFSNVPKSRPVSPYFSCPVSLYSYCLLLPCSCLIVALFLSYCCWLWWLISISAPNSSSYDGVILLPECIYPLVNNFIATFVWQDTRCCKSCKKSIIAQLPNDNFIFVALPGGCNIYKNSTTRMIKEWLMIWVSNGVFRQSS